MKQTVYFSDFTAAFHRADRGNQFTCDGLRVLFEYIEQYEQDCGEEIELDVIALCCEYSEECADDIIASYCLESDTEGMSCVERRDFVRDYLSYNTQLCGETAARDFVYLTF